MFIIINEVFPAISDNFLFLQAHKDHTLSVTSKQEFDGNGVIELAKHGALYLVENPLDEPAESESVPPVSSGAVGGSSHPPTTNISIVDSTRAVVQATASKPSSFLPLASQSESSPSVANLPAPQVTMQPYSNLSEENRIRFERADDVLDKINVAKQYYTYINYNCSTSLYTQKPVLPEGYDYVIFSSDDDYEVEVIDKVCFLAGKGNIHS